MAPLRGASGYPQAAPLLSSTIEKNTTSAVLGLYSNLGSDVYMCVCFVAEAKNVRRKAKLLLVNLGI